MLDLINKETRQIPAWTVVPRARSGQSPFHRPPTPLGMGDSAGNFTVSCIPELPLSSPSPCRCTSPRETFSVNRYVNRIRLIYSNYDRRFLNRSNVVPVFNVNSRKSSTYANAIALLNHIRRLVSKESNDTSRRRLNHISFSLIKFFFTSDKLIIRANR